MKKIKSTLNCKLIKESQNDPYKKYSVFDDLQDGSKQKSVAFRVYNLVFDDVTTSKPTEMLKCCTSEKNDNIKNTLSGIMANVLKLHSSFLVERIR